MKNVLKAFENQMISTTEAQTIAGGDRVVDRKSGSIKITVIGTPTGLKGKCTPSRIAAINAIPGLSEATKARILSRC